MTDTDLAQADLAPTPIETAPTETPASLSVDETVSAEPIPAETAPQPVTSVPAIQVLQKTLDAHAEELPAESSNHGFIQELKAKLREVEQYILTYVIKPIESEF